jgi:hypothetical protein
VDLPARADVPRRPDLGAERFPPPPGPWSAGPPSGRPPRRSRLPAAVALIVLASLLAAVAAPLLRHPEVEPRAVGPKGDYTFILTTGGDPVRWNPCESIHYVLSRDGLTEGAIEDVDGAIERLSDVTGLSFTYDGLTDEEPSRTRRSYQPERYGERWAPVLIAWVDPAESSIPFEEEGHEAAAVAAPQLPDDGADDVFVSGWVAVNADDPNPSGFQYPGMQGPVVLHELAHVVGLGHATSQGNLMEPSGGGVTTFGPGDLAGLARLGSDAGCLLTPVVGP